MCGPYRPFCQNASQKHLPGVTCPSRRLPQECHEHALVDVGGLAHLNVPHVLAFAFEKSLRVLQRRAAEETKLDVIRSRVYVGHRHVALHPAAVAPLHRLPESWRNALHERTQGADDRAVFWRLVNEVVIEVGVPLHFHRPPPYWLNNAMASLLTQMETNLPRADIAAKHAFTKGKPL